MRLGTLYPLPPYNLHQTASLLSRYHGVLDHYENNAYLRAVSHADGVALIRVTDAGTPLNPALDVDLLAGVPAPGLLARTAHILATDIDLDAFFAYAEQHPRLWHVVEPLIGVRHFRGETVFEALMTVIIEQQISLYAALRAQRAVAVWGGTSVDHDGSTYYTFPTPQTIAAADPAILQATLKITHRRVALMQRIARDVVSGVLDIETDTDCARAYERLMAIKGVGHWTAAWTLIRGVGCYDYVGHNDVALRSAAAHYFHDSDTRISAEAVQTTFAAYAPYSGLAAFYTLLRWAMDRY